MLTESAARWLLLLHTALGVAAVAAATHLVIWLRRYLRGRQSRRSVIKFAVIVLTLQLGAFALGNTMYPTYKVEVRTAFLESATAIDAQAKTQATELSKIAEREHAEPPIGAATQQLVKRAAQAARWFDVKEHWVALGLFTSAALLLVLALWDPARDGRTIAPIVMTLAVIVAATILLAAIIGVLTASWRAV